MQNRYRPTHNKLRSVLPILLCGILCFSGLLRQAIAQKVTATLTGTVIDASGAALPDTSVTITQIETGTKRTLVTNAEGIFTATQLPPSTYNISFEHGGFTTVTQSNVVLAINQTASVNVTLTVGATQQTAEVSGSAPLLQTEDVSLGEVVETRQVVDLPLNGRSFSQLLQLSPGVVPINVGQSFTPGIGAGSVTPGVDGQTNRANLTFIDGVLVTDNLFSDFSVQPSIDAIQTFQVQTHASDAQFGQSTGGTFNIATRSGTNNYHGTAYEFFRNQSLDALPYFATANNPFRLNDFGGTLGGPVKKDKLFLFGYYEGVRQTQASTVASILPTAAEISGDFSALLPQTVIYDPATYDPKTKATQPFPGNKIDPSRLNAGLLTVLKAYVPVAGEGASPTAINFLNTQASTITQNQYSFRGDYTISPANLLYSRYTYNHALTQSPGQLPDNGFLSNYQDKNLAVNYVRTQSSTMTAQITFGINLFAYPLYYQQKNAQAVFDSGGFAAGFTPTPGNIGAPYVPGLHPSGYFNLSSGWGGQGQNQQRLYQLSGVVFKQAARHSLRFGSAFYWSGETGNFAEDDIYFNQQATSNPCAAQDTSGTCEANGGNSLASMLLGLPVSANRQLGSSLVNVYNYVTGLFAEDSWKITPRFTANYGLRWDNTTPPLEVHNRYSGFDPHTGLWYTAKGNIATPATLPPGVVVLNGNQLTKPNYKNFSPRLGFNYLLTPKTTLLAGAGIFFDNWSAVLQGAQGQRGSWPNGATQGAFNVNTAGVTPGATAQNPFGNTQPVIPASPFPSSGNFTDNRFRNPYSSQWNLQIQQQIGNSSLASLAYVGSSTARIGITRPANTNLTPGPTLDIPFPQMSQFGTFESSGHASYNALQAQFNKRYNAGLTVTGAFTWAHVIDVGCSDIFVNCQIQNARDLGAERADASIDVPIVFTASALYELPFGRGKSFATSGWQSAVFGHFQLNTLFVTHSGTPINPTINVDNANNNGGTQRPDVSGDPHSGPHTVAKFFNTAAYAVAAPYSFGNAGRNSLRGPKFTNLDLSLFRSFPLLRENRLELRVEGFNALNHPQFGNPDATLEDANFGRITSTIGNPREIQLAAKYVF